MTTPTSAPRRSVTDEEIATFWRDGVVCLRDILPLDVVMAMADPIDRMLAADEAADLTAMADALESGAGATRLVDEGVAASGVARGTFRGGTDHWCVHPEFAEFATTSPVPTVVAALLRSKSVWLYEDSVLVKEPGTQERTGFHQDMAYFHLDGENVCTTWIPLDEVDYSTGAVVYVVGSHLDHTEYRPNMFVSDMQLPGTVGEAVPDYSMIDDAPIVSFETKPGDLVVHHARTIHGAGANASATRRRRAISIRYAGDGVVFHRRVGAPEKPHHAGLRDGDRLSTPAFPLAHG
ncbi:MAG: phytanoyl-CoA dioxygenase family protein [Acidimicrobiia bacterium]|nr:phytanoyl-CoA dioxygenase family protein [Acidimicrobiia bacterium]